MARLLPDTYCVSSKYSCSCAFHSSFIASWPSLRRALAMTAPSPSRFARHICTPSMP